MKILLIHNAYQTKGGEDVYVENQKKLLEKNGHQVFLYLKKNESISHNLLQRFKIGMSLLSNSKVEKELKNVITRFKPDLAHLHNLYPLIGPSIIPVLNNALIPIIQTLHNYRMVCPKGTLFRDGKICTLCIDKYFPYPSVVRQCYHHSYLASGALATSMAFHKIRNTFSGVNTYIYPSKYSSMDLLKDSRDQPSSQHVVIPYFTFPQQIQQSKNNKCFLYLGRLSEEKGIAFLLKYFKSHSKYTLKIVGDGPLTGEVFRLSQQSKNIIYQGPLNHEKSMEQLRNASALIVSSEWNETGPIVMIEAFEARIPVIVRRMPYINEKLIHGKTGYLYETEGELDRIIKRVLENKKEVRSITQNAYQKFEKLYSPNAHYQLLLNTYTNAIQNDK